MHSRLQLVLACLVAGPVAARAQSDTARVSDLIVTATRVPTPEAAIPAATTVLRGDDLRAQGVRLVLDALREVPGLSVVQTGSYGAVASVFLRGGESDYVKVMLDGVPLNQPGGAMDFANLTTADLDRIEIVRGPASVLYGADAMTGVIQLFTRRASDRGSVEITGEGGTFGTNDFASHLDAAGQQWSVSATGTRFASDGFYPFNSDYRNTVGSTRIGFDDGAAGSAALTVRYGDGITHFPTDGEGNPVDHNQFTEERTLAAALDATRPVGAHGSLHLLGFASRLDQGYTNRMDSPADTTGFDFIEDRADVSWRRGVDLRGDWQATPRTLLSVGAGLEHETDDASDIGTSNFGDGASPDTSALTGTRTTRNVYGQLLAAPVEAISMQLGARVDDNSAFGTFGTWRAGVTWHIVKDTRIWGSAGTAFKAPTFEQLFEQSAFEVGNPDLAPERSRNSELGAETQLFDQRLRLGVTAFWEQFRDLIQFIDAAPGQPNYTNLGGADSRGVEATALVRANNRITVDAHWTWLHTAVTDTGAASSATFTEGAPLIRRPASSGGATLTYRWHRWDAAATVTRVGARDDVDFSGVTASRVILPAYTTMDLALAVPIRAAAGRSPGVTLTLRGENLLNAVYEQTVGFPGRGRTLLAGGSLLF